MFIFFRSRTIDVDTDQIWKDVDWVQFIDFWVLFIAVFIIPIIRTPPIWYLFFPIFLLFVMATAIIVSEFLKLRR